MKQAMTPHTQAAPNAAFDKTACRRRDMGRDGAMGECLSTPEARCSHATKFSYGYICNLSRADWSAMFQQSRHS